MDILKYVNSYYLPFFKKTKFLLFRIAENPTQARIYAIAVSISLASLVILFCGWRWWSHKKKRQKAVEMYYAQKQAEEQARNQPQQGYYASPPPPPQIMDEAPPAYVEIRSDTNPQPSSTAY
jgi:hypothetical protein